MTPDYCCCPKCFPSNIHQEAKPLTVEQVGWKWIEGQSTDDYTCGFQPYNESGKDWFIAHKWEPVYIIRGGLPRMPSREEVISEIADAMSCITAHDMERAQEAANVIMALFQGGQK